MRSSMIHRGNLVSSTPLLYQDFTGFSSPFAESANGRHTNSKTIAHTVNIIPFAIPTVSLKITMERAMPMVIMLRETVIVSRANSRNEQRNRHLPPYQKSIRKTKHDCQNLCSEKGIRLAAHVCSLANAGKRFSIGCRIPLQIRTPSLTESISSPLI
jgi:hypothetical protein